MRRTDFEPLNHQHLESKATPSTIVAHHNDHSGHTIATTEAHGHRTLSLGVSIYVRLVHSFNWF